jgi:nucleoside-diphosphate-sugar epimerase
MRVLVTGARGFIGREIVSELSEADLEVYQTSGSKFSASEQDSETNGNFITADITDYENLKEIEKLGWMDAIIHCAGLAHQFSEIKAEKFNAVNVAGTENILKLSHQLRARQFILISSTAVYGIKKTPRDKKDKPLNLVIDENADCKPETLYAESKLEAEGKAIEFCEKNNIALTILRLAPVIGEGNVGNVERLIESIDKGRFLWIGKGENLKSLIYKNDVARACGKILAQKKGATEIFNIAAKPVKMFDFVSLIAKQLKKEIPKYSIPAELFEFLFKVKDKFPAVKKVDRLLRTIEKWLSDDVYSADKIAEVYNFKTKTSIEQAIERQIDWYKNKKQTDKSKK